MKNKIHIPLIILMLTKIDKISAHSSVDTNNNSISLLTFILVLSFIILCFVGFYLLVKEYIPNNNFLTLRKYTIISTIVIVLNSIVIIGLYVEV